jgi:hypothetical protein
MRGLIQSLCPEDRQIDWKWIGCVFALYVVVMVAAVPTPLMSVSFLGSARGG